MDSLNLSSFLFEKVQQTVNYSQYIREVNISYRLDGGFGNEYITVTYNESVNDNYHNLSLNAKQSMFIGKPHYVFSLSTHAELGRSSEKRKLLRIIEFKHIYESLAIYVGLQLESVLSKEIPIKIMGIDFWPEANYAAKRLNKALYIKHDNLGNNFENDVSQWDRLHELANISREIYDKKKTDFNITDEKINDLLGLGITDIRYLILRYEIPIKIEGVETIDKVYIHALSLVEALKTEIKNEYYIRNQNLYQDLITYLYDSKLSSEKNKIIAKQKAEFIRHLIIQKGDILQLKNKRIVVANSIRIDTQNEIIIEYLILKTNLEIGTRKREIPFNNIEYVLNEEDFLKYKDYTPTKHISLLNKWILKRKKKVELIVFEPDLTKENTIN